MNLILLPDTCGKANAEEKRDKHRDLNDKCCCSSLEYEVDLSQVLFTATFNVEFSHMCTLIMDRSVWGGGGGGGTGCPGVLDDPHSPNGPYLVSKKKIC